MEDRTIDVPTLQVIVTNLELALATPNAEVTRVQVRAALSLLQTILRSPASGPAAAAAAGDRSTGSPASAASLAPPMPTGTFAARATSPGASSATTSAAVPTADPSQAREAAAKYGGGTQAAGADPLWTPSLRPSTLGTTSAAAATTTSTSQSSPPPPSLRGGDIHADLVADLDDIDDLPVSVGIARELVPPPQYERHSPGTSLGRTGSDDDWLRATLRAANAGGTATGTPGRAHATGSGMTHRWSEGIKQFPDPTNNFHGRECALCGLRQYYGKAYGSNKHPGWSSVPAECPGSTA